VQQRRVRGGEKVKNHWSSAFTSAQRLRNICLMQRFRKKNAYFDM